MIKVDVWIKRRKTLAIKMLKEKAILDMKDIDNNIALHWMMKLSIKARILSSLSSTLGHISQRPLIEIRTRSRAFQYRKPFKFFSSRFYSVSINSGKPYEVKLER